MTEDVEDFLISVVKRLFKYVAHFYWIGFYYYLVVGNPYPMPYI